MAEKLVPAEVQIVDMDCDTCQQGQMRPTGQSFMSMPPKYEHKCNNPECGKVISFPNTYPHLIYSDGKEIRLRRA